MVIVAELVKVLVLLLYKPLLFVRSMVMAPPTLLAKAAKL